MNVILNDKAYQIAAETSLAAFVESLGLKPEGIAVAIDYEVVPKESWANTQLSENMELTLIQAVSGG